MSSLNSVLIYKIMLHSYRSDIWGGCGKNEERTPHHFSAAGLSFPHGSVLKSCTMICMVRTKHWDCDKFKYKWNGNTKTTAICGVMLMSK